MSQTVAIIPARANSKGVPGKNIRKFGGHPLIAWSIMAGLRSKLIDRVIVSTDSAEYKDIALSYGAEVPFLRPNFLSGDNSTDYEFIKHSINWFQENDKDIDLLVQLRPTSPIRHPMIIDDAVNIFATANNEPSSLRSIHKMPESGYKNFEISVDGFLRGIGTDTKGIDHFNGPRQSFPDTFIANGYVDVMKVSFINENELLHGERSIGFITPETMEIDVESDCEKISKYIDENQNLVRILFS